jgi:hypothetical protein
MNGVTGFENDLPSNFGSSGGGGGGFNIMSGIQGLGGIGEIIGSLLQSSQYSQMLGGLTNSLNSVIGPETQFGSGFLSNYQNTVLPELQSSYGQNNALGLGSYGSAGGYATGAAGAAGNLQNNPYLAAQTPLIGGLENYKSFTPQEQAALTSGAGAAAQSAASTFAAQSGATPNSALLEKQLVGQAGQTSSQTAVQLGSIASQQHLQAMEAALQGSQTQSSQYLQGQQEAGGLYSGLSQEYAGLSQSELGQALDALNISSNESSVGEGLLGNAGSSIGSLLSQVYSNAQSNQGGLGGIMGGLTSLAPLLAGL